jgi:hypothetical protein
MSGIDVISWIEVVIKIVIEIVIEIVIGSLGDHLLRG